jgi:hypothetical protein
MINTQLRYFLGVDPSTLDDEEWATEWDNLRRIREAEKAASVLKPSLQGR